jgi:DNA-directed RNA polymerase specialized sigma24 family protein
MKDTARFDAFYADARGRLLHQTYALTGDLPLAQASVRDAFVGAWHHWRKVSRLEDPERWVRPLAWSHASRRSTTRLWARHRSADPEVTATLDALGRLSLTQRKVLLLSQLTTGSMEDVAREAELPLSAAEDQLQSATALFASHRGIDSALIRAVLDPLAVQVADVSWPRVALIRRAGGARRRTHALVGVTAVAALLVISGVTVTQEEGLRPRLTKEKVVAAPRPASITPSEEPVELSPDQLLTAQQMSRVAPRRRWTVETTEENVTDEGPVIPCQETRYADPRAVGGLVRTFGTRPARVGSGRTEGRRQGVSGVQSTELSATPQRARRAYRTTTEWYAGCPEDRVQLLDTRDVEGVGDAATLLLLRSWTDPGTTMVVGVARSGEVTTTTFSEASPAATSTNVPMAGMRAQSSLLAAAVNSLCGSPGTGTCAGPPKPLAALPARNGREPGMM